jgi:hypothetical protein
MLHSSFRTLAEITLVASCLGVALAGCVVHDDAGRDPHYAEHHQDHPDPHQGPDQPHQEEHH